MLVLGIFDPSQSPAPGDLTTVGVSLALVGISIVTASAANRSGQGGEVDDEVMTEGEPYERTVMV